jgi:phosphoglycerol transferase MdoB-like AlkP superfamily enzyme
MRDPELCACDWASFLAYHEWHAAEYVALAIIVIFMLILASVYWRYRMQRSIAEAAPVRAELAQHPSTEPTVLQLFGMEIVLYAIGCAVIGAGSYLILFFSESDWHLARYFALVTVASFVAMAATVYRRSCQRL